QLYYQIAIHGRRDLPLAPEPRAGLEMTLLRMLAFRPDTAEEGSAGSPPGGRRSRPGGVSSGGQFAPKSQNPDRSPSRAAESASAQDSVMEGPAAERAQATPSEPAAVAPDTAGPASSGDKSPPGNWSALVDGLGLKGLARQLADNCQLEGWDGDNARLQIDPAGAQLQTPGAVGRLEKALGRFLGRPVKVRIRVTEALEDTPARQQQARQEAREQEARESIERDPNLQALREEFGAELEPRAVRFRAPKGNDQAPS
ncbi:DNA polymerase III subunit gamma/tau C-terminal domain-containing protein, partial [Natronospira sp.]